MLRSLYVMLDYHVAASDGEQGTVQDFLFDDETWIIHYLVGGGSRKNRNVLILPFAVGSPDWQSRRLPVFLTKEQIRACPPFEFDMPISSQRLLGQKHPGSHLRSVREVLGYSIHATDGEVGTVEDFIIEDTLWGVHHIVVAVKNGSRSVLLPPEAMRSISWSGKAGWVNLSVEEVCNRPSFDPSEPVNRDEADHLFDYYGRPIFRPAA